MKNHYYSYNTQFIPDIIIVRGYIIHFIIYDEICKDFNNITLTYLHHSPSKVELN